MKTMVRICGVLLLFVLLSFTYSEGRTVTGSVVDKRGNMLKNAVVQLEDELSLAVRSYVTAADGQYRFTGLSRDIHYTLRAHYRKEWSKPKSLSEFDSSTNPVVDLVIPID